MSSTLTLSGKEFLIDKNLLITNINPFDSRNAEYITPSLLNEERVVHGSVYFFSKLYFNEPTKEEFSEIKTINDFFDGFKIGAPIYEQLDTTFKLDGLTIKLETAIEVIPNLYNSSIEDYEDYFIVLKINQINNIKTYNDIPKLEQELLILLPSIDCISTVEIEFGEDIKKYYNSASYVKTIYSDQPTNNNNFGVSIAYSINNIFIGSPRDGDKGSYAGKVEMFTLDGVYVKTIYGNDPEAADQFGISIGCTSTNIFVGSYGDNDKGTNAGKVEMFTLDGVYVKTIYGNDPKAADYFGYSIACSTDNIYIGSQMDDDKGTNAGKVEMFTLDGTYVKTIYSDQPATNNNFGYSIACSTDNIYIGSQMDDDKGTNAGKVEMFTLDGTYVKTIYSDQPATNNNFGVSIACSIDNIYIGSIGDGDKGPSAGKVEMFTLDGTYVKTIYGNEPKAQDQFGYSIACSINNIFIGSPRDTDKGTYTGKVEMFLIRDIVKDDNQLINLISNDSIVPDLIKNGDDFGTSLAKNSNNIFIGSSYNDDKGTNAGKVEMFTLDGTYVKTIYGNDPKAHVYFGVSVACNETHLYIGSYGDNDKGTNAGKVEMFTLDGVYVKTIYGNDPKAYDRFGYSIACSINNIFIGSSGKPYISVYTLDGIFIKNIMDHNNSTRYEFGKNISCNSTHLFVSIGMFPSYGKVNAGAVVMYDINGNFIKNIIPLYNVSVVSGFFGQGISCNDTTLFISSNSKNIDIYNMNGNYINTLDNVSDVQTYGSSICDTDTLYIGLPTYQKVQKYDITTLPFSIENINIIKMANQAIPKTKLIPNKFGTRMNEELLTEVLNLPTTQPKRLNGKNIEFYYNGITIELTGIIKPTLVSQDELDFLDWIQELANYDGLSKFNDYIYSEQKLDIKEIIYNMLFTPELRSLLFEVFGIYNLIKPFSKFDIIWSILQTLEYANITSNNSGKTNYKLKWENSNLQYISKNKDFIGICIPNMITKYKKDSLSKSLLADYMNYYKSHKHNYMYDLYSNLTYIEPLKEVLENMEILEVTGIPGIDYYIGTNGNNTNDGLTPHTPFKDCSNIPSGSVIGILPGIYTRKIMLNLSGNSNEGSVIEAFHGLTNKKDITILGIGSVDFNMYGSSSYKYYVATLFRESLENVVIKNINVLYTTPSRDWSNTSRQSFISSLYNPHLFPPTFIDCSFGYIHDGHWIKFYIYPNYNLINTIVDHYNLINKQIHDPDTKKLNQYFMYNNKLYNFKAIESYLAALPVKYDNLIIPISNNTENSVLLDITKNITLIKDIGITF